MYMYFSDKVWLRQIGVHSALESLVVGKKFVSYVTITQSFGIAQGSKWAQKQNFLTRAFWVIAILRFSLT